MPDITGTNGADTIDVTDDSGTVNGGTAVTPVDSIRGRRGDDDISVTDSTITGIVNSGAGSDTISVSGSTLGGRLTSGGDNDVVNVEGSNIESIRLGNGDDTLNFLSTNITGSISGNRGTDSLNLPVGTIITDSTFGTVTVSDGGSYSLSNGTFVLPSGITVTYTAFENGTGFPCLVRGALIDTPVGRRRVEDIRIGDFVLTQQNGPQQIRWIGQRKFSSADLCKNPKLRPIRIAAEALGGGLPKRDLLVSRQHRMLVRSKIAERMFGCCDVLISAIKLTELPGIFADNSIEEVEYFHLLFDQHEIIFAEGTPTESLFTGPEALKSLSPLAKEEIMTIFPEVAAFTYAPKSACYIPSGRLQKKLIARHRKNEMPLLRKAVQSSQYMTPRTALTGPDPHDA